MFVLTLMKDIVELPPVEFDRDTLSVLTDVIDMKFSNRVIQDVGLIVCMRSFTHIGDAYLYPSQGAAHHQVEFQLIVFRPFIGELITGTVSRCTRDGVYVSLGFFNDVFVPSHFMAGESLGSATFDEVR
jgi:DNA-directed RNA polymerase III subunit RPC8